MVQKHWRFKLKTEARKKARALRKRGASVREITRELGVSKGSVSRWVRDIQLTEEQRAVLDTRGPGRKGAEAVREKHLRIRKQYQKEGAKQAQKREWLHVAGCMLYWAEGTKSRNVLKLVNTDLEMLRLFLRFTKKYLGVTTEKVRVVINCYPDLVSITDCSSYWLEGLGLPESCLSSVGPKKSASSKHKRKSVYGVCELIVYDQQAVQHVYGAIQEYGAFSNEEWLD